ncbi:MAG: prohibitin family protein [Thermofilaceae archaeon]
MMEEVPFRVRGRRRIEILVPIAAFLSLLVIALLVICVYSVALGEVAITVDPITGAVSKPVLGPSLAFKAPWAYVVTGYVGVEAVDMFFEPPRDYPAVIALTRDGVMAEVDITIRYKLIPERFDILVRQYPRLNYEEDFLVATARQVVREVLANYSMTDTIEKRDVVARAIESELSRRIKADPVIGVCLELLGVNMRNIRLPDAVINAINEKVAAQQRALKAEYDRQAALIQANASAQSALIQAEGQAKALLTISQAQAESVKLIANLTGVPAEKILSYYFYLQTIKELAASQKAVVVVSPSGVAPLISVPGG